jgi:hypothetical protein
MAAIGQRSVEERPDEWASLNDAVAVMEAAAVRRQHPDYTDREVFLVIVRRRYGDDLERWAPELGVVDDLHDLMDAVDGD